MLHVGLDLSRHRLDVRVLDETGASVAELAVAPTGTELRRLGALAAVDVDGRLRGIVTIDQIGRALRTAVTGDGTTQG